MIMNMLLYDQNMIMNLLLYDLLVAVVRDGRGLWLAVLDVIILLLVGEPGVVAAAVQGEEAGSCSVSL